MTSFSLPPDACDAHLHVFGDPNVYPSKIGAAYPPPPCTIADMESLHRAHGISRAVLVQPLIYGTDHRVMIAALEGRPRCRGVAVIDSSVTDDELAKLHRAGVRGARIGLGGGQPSGFDRLAAEKVIERIQPLGWHIKLGGSGKQLQAQAAWFRSLVLPVVIDHLALVMAPNDLDGEYMRCVLDLLQQPNWWVLLANPDRRSRMSPLWHDMLPIMRALAKAAPDRALWASDWPHVLYQHEQPPLYGELLNALFEAVQDEKLAAAILVDNPQRLYGFDE